MGIGIEKVKYTYYSGSGKPIDNIDILFDFNDNVIKIGDRKYKVKDNNEFTYKFQKTQVKAVDGIVGFRKFIEKAMDRDSVWHSFMFGTLKKVSEG